MQANHELTLCLIAATVGPAMKAELTLRAAHKTAARRRARKLIVKMLTPECASWSDF
jgi:hypothetical protein